MNKKTIDLSDIKENDLDKTSSFTDLMTRSERRKRKLNNDSLDKTIEIDKAISDIKKSNRFSI